MRSRMSLVVLLVGVVLSACMPASGPPRPTGTLEPSITESSVEPTSQPDNVACELLTAEERSDLVGMSMDAEVPVRPAVGTHECVWAHSLSEQARAAIRVTAVNSSEWVPKAAEPITRAIAHPGTSKALASKLQDALRDITSNSRDLSDARVCEIYLLFSETRGMAREQGGMLLVGTIGSLPTVFAAACENGYIVLAGFGEYGLTSSFALNHGVVKLVQAAIDRVDDVLGSSTGIDGEEADENADGETDENADEDTTESPSPEPSDTAEAADDETDEESDES